MSYKIIIHDGKAHMDELLASALLAIHLEEEPDSITRVDSLKAAEMAGAEKLADDTYFIDCGLVFDISRNLFDHHQDKDLDCAALLIFDEFFAHLKNTELHRYIELVSKVDRNGPMSLNDFDVLDESRDYLTFSQQIVLKTFEEDPMLILRIFIAGLEDKINFEIQKAMASDWLKQTGNIEITTVLNINILKYLNKPPKELVPALRSASGEIVDKNNVSSILSFDNKNPDVLTFYRTDYGHKIVDFSKTSPSNTVFCHQGGFLLKFIPSDDEEWIKLFKQAVKNN
ncbi:MAG: MYG1 family protein [Spirochaetales bacterium]|uniref:MYG1 family protein n=1 Tax=Candidatus Thalassospirochaeta sargassi TaxID=3119039 RepID=A0AAJ1IB35_9SPIO|nr:MYG1 family protein [Spirochaetales bacterium]